MQLNSGLGVGYAVISTMSPYIGLPKVAMDSVTAKIKSDNSGITWEVDDDGQLTTEPSCSELVLEDLKIQLGDYLYTIPSSQYAADYHNDCEINIVNA